jgi:hypothetical protein
MDRSTAELFATETAPGTAWVCTLEGIALEAGVRSEEPSRPLVAPLLAAFKRLFASPQASASVGFSKG